MHRMISFIIVFAALSSPPMGIAVAEQDTPNAGEAPVPKGHERFFKQLAALAKKYPKSADRFTIVDKQPKGEAATPGAPTHDGAQPTAGSFHACCEWTLHIPRKCVEECKE